MVFPFLTMISPAIARPQLRMIRTNQWRAVSCKRQLGSPSRVMGQQVNTVRALPAISHSVERRAWCHGDHQ